MFVFCTDKLILINLVYVDDILITRSDFKAVNEFTKRLDIRNPDTMSLKCDNN